jgi:Uma2 family endonuclease
MTTIPTTSDVLSSAPITLFALGDSQAISIPSAARSLRGFRNWALSEEFPQRGRYSFIEGELIIDMSPEFFETHNAVKVEITSVVHRRAKQLHLGYVFGDRSLLSNETAGLSTEPDAMFVSHDSFKSGRCQILDSPRPGVAQELAGSPDWVLEIVSKTTVRKDTKLLRQGYFCSGIGEYWLVDALGDDINFQILVPDAKGYVAVEAQDDWIESPTFGCSFRLTREKVDDDFWQYTLDVKENS